MKKFNVLLLMIIFLYSCKNNTSSNNNQNAKIEVNNNEISSDYDFSNKEIIINVPAKNYKYHFCSDKVKMCRLSHPTIDSEYTCRYGTWIKNNDLIKMKYSKSINKKGIGKPISEYTPFSQYEKYEYIKKEIEENDELEIDYLRNNLKNSPNLFKIKVNNNCDWLNEF